MTSHRRGGRSSTGAWTPLPDPRPNVLAPPRFTNLVGPSFEPQPVALGLGTDGTYRGGGSQTDRSTSGPNTCVSVRRACQFVPKKVAAHWTVAPEAPGEHGGTGAPDSGTANACCAVPHGPARAPTSLHGRPAYVVVKVSWKVPDPVGHREKGACNERAKRTGSTPAAGSRWDPVQTKKTGRGSPAAPQPSLADPPPYPGRPRDVIER
jgi:hypothetical protein